MTWVYFSIIAIISRSLSIIVQKSMLKGVDKDPIAYSIVFQLVTGIIIAIYLVFTGFHSHDFTRAIPNLMITTILSATGNILMFQSIQLIDASEFTILYSSRVIWSIVGMIIFLKSPFSLVQIMGAALIIGSVILVKGLIWDDWNKEHINKHSITTQEVEEVCHSKHKIIDSYRKRLLLIGKTKSGRKLAVVLSPEDRNMQPYGKDVYYAITTFEKEV